MELEEVYGTKQVEINFVKKYTSNVTCHACKNKGIRDSRVVTRMEMEQDQSKMDKTTRLIISQTRLQAISMD